MAGGSANPEEDGVRRTTPKEAVSWGSQKGWGMGGVAPEGSTEEGAGATSGTSCRSDSMDHCR